MKSRFDKTYTRDLTSIVDKTLKQKVKQAVLTVENATTMREIPSLKKLKGYKIHYRIRVGKYRIGITIEGDLVTFVRCLPRKNFYQKFPEK